MEDRARQYLICQEWVSQVKSRRVKLKSRQAKSSHGKVRQERCKRDRSMTIVTVKYVLAHRHDLCVTWSSSVSSRHPLHDVSHGVPKGSVIGIVPSEKDDTQPWNSRSNIIERAWAEYLLEGERECVRECVCVRERECVCVRGRARKGQIEREHKKKSDPLKSSQKISSIECDPADNFFLCF